MVFPGAVIRATMESTGSPLTLLHPVLSPKSFRVREDEGCEAPESEVWTRRVHIGRLKGRVLDASVGGQQGLIIHGEHFLPSAGAKGGRSTEPIVHAPAAELIGIFT